MRAPLALFRGAGGMFSNIWHVVGFVEWCRMNGKKPLVDLRSVRAMNYWSGTEPRNSWTEYFAQVSDADLELALDLNNFEVFQGRPEAFPVSEYSTDLRYRKAFRDTIALSERSLAFIDPWLEFLSQEGRVLGVHMRGSDMKIAKSHWAPPTNFQIFQLVDEAMERGGFDAIFVASEDEKALTKIHARYGKRVLTSDSFRTRTKRKLTRTPSPVLQWPFLLGLQVIRDAWMLSRCEGLVSGHSNVSEHAQVLRSVPYSINLQIRRPRVDILGSSRLSIAATNLLREASVSRFRGPDFKVIDRSRDLL
jgi:hypothetical protein